MNENKEELDLLKPLLIDLLEDQISEAQTDRLRGLLRDDPAILKDYTDYMTLCALLQWENAPPLVSKDVLAGPAAEAVAKVLPGPGFLGRFTRSGGPLAALMLAAVLLLCLGVFWAGSHFSPFGDQRPGLVESHGISSEPNVPKSDRPAAVARLIRLSTVEWADPEHKLAEWTQLAEGQEIDMAAGRAEILFSSGAQLILEGQVRFQILGPMKARLYHGKLTARIGEEAKGFGLVTPNGTVVDLGTEFGLSVQPTGETDVVVFDGIVDFHYQRPADPGNSGQIVPNSATWQLVTGEALRVDRDGVASRIVSILSDQFPRTAAPRRLGPIVIESVTDNIREFDSMPFYQIVRGGLDEDVRAYVDRKHEWNGIDELGIPSFLRGADYIMSFNSDKPHKDLEISVRIACPADVYVFWDERVQIADWLLERFTNTGLRIGMDETPWRDFIRAKGELRGLHRSAAIGPGKSIDMSFTIWKLHVPDPTTVTFGPLGTYAGSMYGIAAVTLTGVNQ